MDLILVVKNVTKAFSNKDSLKYHVKVAHEQVNLECTFCKKIFKSSRVLKRHVTKTHEKKCESVKCDICNREFNMTEQMRGHKKRVHENIKKEQNCEMCQKTFKNIHYLRQHKKETPNKTP